MNQLKLLDMYCYLSFCVYLIIYKDVLKCKLLMSFKYARNIFT